MNENANAAVRHIADKAVDVVDIVAPTLVPMQTVGSPVRDEATKQP